jgi:tRNA(Ile)-lysidine synthase
MTRIRKTPVTSNATATRLGEALPVGRLHPTVREWVGKSRTRGPWCVAFSGGADSLALLLLLWTHWPERRGQLIALHFNHRLRGAAAEADERFCRETCRALDVKCVVGRWRAARPGASEAESRTARHAFFATAMQRAGSRVLWLAHQQDDIAESMLMRLARGSGTGGLAAPRPLQRMGDGRFHLRPLLTLGKAELTTALRGAGGTWREDASNARPDHFRNRIRQTVVPAWQKAAGRDALAGAALARERLEEDDAALEAWVDRAGLLSRAKVLDVRACEGLPRAVVRRALHRWLLAVRPQTDLSRQGFELLLAAVERGTATRFSLGSGFAVLRRGELVLFRA